MENRCSDFMEEKCSGSDLNWESWALHQSSYFSRYFSTLHMKNLAVRSGHRFQRTIQPYRKLFQRTFRLLILSYPLSSRLTLSLWQVVFCAFIRGKMPLTRAQLRQRDDAPTPVSDLLALTPFSEPDVLMPDSRENDPGNEGRSEGPLLHPENVSNRTNGDADSRVEDNGNLHDHNADANNEDHADAHDSDGGDSNADDDNANASDANAGDTEGDEDGDSESDRGAAKPSPGDASRRPVAKTRPAQILPAKRRRNTRSNAPSSKNRGVAELNSENEDEMDFKGCTEKKWEDRILLPNEMMLRGGNSTAFVHRLLGGEVIIVNYLDIYHASLKRFINENVLQIAVDLILRDKGCIPEEGWVWMHETMLGSQIARNKAFERRVPPALRMKAMMSSKVLLAPIHTASSHWSLLAIVNLNSLFEAALHFKPTKHLGHARIEIPEGAAKPLAIHFDSMHQSNHKSAAMLFKKFI